MKDLVKQFLKLGNLMLDAFVKVLSTAKAFLLLDKHCRFVGCHKTVIA